MCPLRESYPGRLNRLTRHQYFKSPYFRITGILSIFCKTENESFYLGNLEYKKRRKNTKHREKNENIKKMFVKGKFGVL